MPAFALVGLLSTTINADQLLAGKTGGFDPVPGKTMLVVGQDLDAVRGYVSSACCPLPMGVTAYIGLYQLSSSASVYQGLGMRPDGTWAQENADWGGGPTNAMTMARENPQSALLIGISYVEANNAGSLQGILEGDYNAQIDQLARFIQEVDNTVVLRLGYEFDGAWNPGYENANLYAEVFRYITLRLRKGPDQNFRTVWQASASPIDDVLDGQRESIESWYPGDDVVDWIGLSWFLAPDEKPLRQVNYVSTQRQLSEEVVKFARARNKPVIIAEASPQGYDLTNVTRRNISPIWDGVAGEERQQVDAELIWRQWYAPLFNYIDTNRDVIAALAYININWDSQDLWDSPYEQGYWGDSRVQKNKTIMQRWNQEMGKPGWVHSGVAGGGVQEVQHQ